MVLSCWCSAVSATFSSGPWLGSISSVDKETCEVEQARGGMIAGAAIWCSNLFLIVMLLAAVVLPSHVACDSARGSGEGYCAANITSFRLVHTCVLC